ncbi:hypothetical protein CL653_02475 [bacterium]|nr:hypothetical protein [bacterium]
MRKYVTLYKKVGETPLECAETWRQTQSSAYRDTPLAYAGRLDPMAEGKLLVLIGDECKKQADYHGLDKEYVFEVLLGTESDSGDVLGIIKDYGTTTFNTEKLQRVLQSLEGEISLPYPKFSAKTVRGKPLHMWTVEGRLNEIAIPTNISQVYKLKLLSFRTESKESIYKYTTEKIETIPKVTDERKALGNDFRRDEVRTAWKKWLEEAEKEYQIATIKCACGSGTYMRSLAEEIGNKLGSTGLAYSIRRTKIGRYKKLLGFGCWFKSF